MLRQTLKLSLLLLPILLSCCKERPRTIEKIVVELIEVNQLPDTIKNDMAIYIQDYKYKKDNLMNVVIGTSDADMTTEQPEGLLNNYIADVLLDYANQYEPTDFALTNIGGIRRPLFKGDITLGDIYEILPFDNTLILLEFNGNQVQEIADIIAERGGAATSGISFGIKDGKAINVKVDGKPLEADKTYTMVTNDYLSYGNDYFTTLTEAQDREMLEGNIRDVTINHIKATTAKGKIINSKLKHDVYIAK